MSAEASELQFDTAESSSASSDLRCVGCQEALGTYYEVNAGRVCRRCRDKLLAAFNAPHLGGLLRATGLGVVAAALGAGLYYGVAALTGYELGLISIVVGLLVGFAVRMGARGRGGWRYQALAVFLTYVSIASTYMPGLITAMKQKANTPAATQGVAAGATTPDAAAPRTDAAAPNTVAEAPPAAPNAPSATAPGAAAKPERSLSSALAAIGLLFVFMLAVPFLAGVDNFMGLVLIAIALYEAWKVNRGPALTVKCPFDAGTVAAGG